MTRSGSPHLWMIAGPNGSGKSTFYAKARIFEDDQPLWIINPDLLTNEIAKRENLEWLAANGLALDRIKAWLDPPSTCISPWGSRRFCRPRSISR